MSNDLDVTRATLVELCNALVLQEQEDDGETTPAWDKLDKLIDGKVERYQWAASAMRAKKAAILGECEYHTKMLKKLGKPVKAIDGRLERMEKSLLENMKLTGKTVIETAVGTLRVQSAPHIELPEELVVSELPVEFQRTKPPEPDKTKLLALFKSKLKELLEIKGHNGEPLWNKQDAIERAQESLPLKVRAVYSETLGGF